VPKKRRRRRPIKLKKPEVTPGVAPVASEKPEVSPTAAMVAQAILKKPDRVGEDVMTGVEPSVPTNPLPSRTFSPSPLSSSYSPSREDSFLFCNPFPREFDHAKIEEWLSKVKTRALRLGDLGAIVRRSGHTDPDHLQRIQALISATDLPPPPPFSFKSATSS
jgi:hypothetical protein